MQDQMLTGIDIGTSKVACATARIGEGESRPRILGFASVPSHGVKRGQIVDINEVTGAIEEAVEKTERMAGAKINSTFVSVGGPHIESLNSHGVVAIAQPEAEISGDDVERAVEAAKAISISSTREVIEVNPREFIVDGQSGIRNPLGMTGVRLEVNTHIITASLTNLRNLDRSLGDLGIEKQGFVFSGLASALSSVSDTEKELGVVLVDIGGGKTDICIFVEGSLSYSSSIPIGARHVTNDIAVGLRVSLDSAEKIKLYLSETSFKKSELTEKKVGKKDEIDISHLKLPEGLKTLALKTITDGIIRPRLEEIFEKVLEHVEKSGFVTLVPSGVVIVGGGALTIGATETARRTMGMSVRLGSPEHIEGLIDEIVYPQYSTLVGLILYGKENLNYQKKLSFKDFDKILKNFSFKGSYKKVADLFKSFMP